MKEYNKILKIKKYSDLVGCIKKFPVRRIELLLLVVHFVIIILCLMNVFIMPWTTLNKSLFGLRIVILSFLIISILCLIYNQISRKRKKLLFGYYYCIGFYGTLISLGLNILNFIFIFISCIIIIQKLKKNVEKTINYQSILVIDIFSILIVFGMFFLWYSEFLAIYAKTDDNLKDFIEAKIKFYQSQNQKVVNIELSDDNNTRKITDNNYERSKEKNPEEEIISNNKMEYRTSGKHFKEKFGKNNYEASSDETK